MNVKIRFLPDDVTVEAEVGEPVLTVAERAGVLIPTGCLMGSCHACEVEWGDGTPFCACIASIPPSSEPLTIHLYSDPFW